MKHNIIINIILSLIIISSVLSSSDVYDQYEIVRHTANGIIVFNSEPFKEKEEIFIKVTGLFVYEYIDFAFIDNIDLLSDINSKNEIKFEREYPTKTDAQYDPNGAYEYEIKYYTIEKEKKYLGNLKGNNLVIRTYMNGYYDIENTKENFGYSKLVIICISVGIVVIIIIIVLVHIIKRRKQFNQHYPPPTPYNDQQKVPIQNNNGYPPYYPNI